MWKYDREYSREEIMEVMRTRKFSKVFWPKVKKVGECWEWTGAVSRWGYGELTFMHHIFRSHRASWILHNGLITSAQWVCHHCDNPPCVRPDHLFLDDPLTNIRDMDRKGRRVNHPHYGSNHPMAILTIDNVIDIWERLQRNQDQTEMAHRYGVHKATISAIKHKRIWAWLTTHLEDL